MFQFWQVKNLSPKNSLLKYMTVTSAINSDPVTGIRDRIATYGRDSNQALPTHLAQNDEYYCLQNGFPALYVYKLIQFQDENATGYKSPFPYSGGC